MAPKRIKIELEFIPVEEGPPDHGEPVYVIVEGWGPPINQPWRAVYSHARGTWSLFKTGELLDARVSHYAEIPKIHLPKEGKS